MGLKAVVKSLDGLEAPIAALYKKDGEEYRLEVEGMVPKATLDQFRDSNVELKKKNEDLTSELKKYEGVDLTKWKEAEDLSRKVKEGELVKAGKIDEVMNARLEPILKNHETKEKQWETERAQMARDLDTLTIDTKLQEIGVKKGLRPTAVEDMLARGRAIFTRKEGRVVALEKDGTPRLANDGKPLTMEAWVEQLGSDAPHLFQPSNGGGTPPGGGNLPPGTKSMSRAAFNQLGDQQKSDYLLKDKGVVVDA